MVTSVRVVDLERARDLGEQMTRTPDKGAEQQDMILLSLPGVQAFIAESRTTSDLQSASRAVSLLAAEAAQVLRALDVDIVIPAESHSGGKKGRRGEHVDDPAAGAPNRIVALSVPGQGARVAGRAADAVRSLWATWLRNAYAPKLGDGAVPVVPETPGFPDVVWVSVGPLPGGYAE
jgi:CRISPR-associated protein Cmr2